jgi:hypothetical protein
VDWVLIAIFGAIVVVAALLFGMMSVAKRRRAQAAQRALDRRISHVVREAEWVHDQASTTPAPAATEAVDECRHTLMVAIMPLSRRV